MTLARKISARSRRRNSTSGSLDTTRLPPSLLARESERRVRLERAVRASRESLPAFSVLVFGLTPPDHMKPVTEALQAIDAGEISRLLIILPPGHAKSSYVSIVFPAWYLGRHREQHIVGISTTDKLAGTYGETVRAMIETSDEYEAVFPAARPDYDRGWSQDGFYLTRPWAPFDKDPSGYYVGAGGSLIGKRADGLIIDDPLDEQVARSETLLEQRRTWIKRTAFSRLKPRGWAVVAGTLWVEGDVVDSLRESGNYVTIVEIARSPGKQVFASVDIPSGVSWRPSGWMAGEPEEGAT